MHHAGFIRDRGIRESLNGFKVPAPNPQVRWKPGLAPTASGAFLRPRPTERSHVRSRREPSGFHNLAVDTGLGKGWGRRSALGPAVARVERSDMDVPEEDENDHDDDREDNPPEHGRVLGRRRGRLWGGRGDGLQQHGRR